MSQSTVGKLSELLDRQLGALQTVLDVLGRERDALSARDMEALERISAEKQECLAQAATYEQHRRELAPDPATMEHFAEDPVIAERWAQLLDLTRVCRDQNEENGRIIRLQQRRVEKTLTLLRGSGGQPDLYGPDGGNRTRTQTRTPLTSV